MARMLKSFKKNIQVWVGIGTAVFVSVSAYPQSLGVNTYRKFAAQYEGEKEQPLDENTEKLIENILVATDLKPEMEASIDFFTAYGQDPTHRGSCKLRTGAVVGLPATFAYHHVSQVQTDKIQLNNQPIEWDSKAGSLLLNSIVLSEKAKKFAIAREIQYIDTNHVFVEGFFKLSFTLLAYSTGFLLNNLMQLRRVLKPWSRGVVYGAIASAYGVVYLFADDTYYCWRDGKVDKKAVQFGTEFAEGGVEFYNRLLQRNMALRTLMGSEGAALYTVYGNHVASWRKPHATLTERRDHLLTYLEELRKEEKEKQAEKNKNKQEEQS